MCERCQIILNLDLSVCMLYGQPHIHPLLNRNMVVTLYIKIYIYSHIHVYILINEHNVCSKMLLF